MTGAAWIGEASLCPWLLVKGANIQRWRERTAGKFFYGQIPIKTEKAGVKSILETAT